ncbi:ABC transporter substrate-binding protein [Acuticoccus kandeliae]|uniref:ABC transporter substrate-binding protein n=1 Tax=Acuticoccus kandeliae TaxID=2073160 RepID=UPI001300544D|nr:ABC transporter substrate-binding protein [Acuticoccus kandeliae]
MEGPRITRRAGLLAGAFAMFALAGAAPASALDHVIMRINFTPWGMHSPWFGGKAQGFFEEEGIDLEIRPPSAGQQNEVFIGTGREQFGLANADSFIKARASGLPVVAVMADQPDTPFSVITLKESGIDTPEALKGKKISWFQTNVKGLLDPVLSAADLTRDDIEFVAVARGAEVQMLAAKQVDALFGYSFGQALTLDMRGFPTSVMPVKDYGAQFYGTVVYTNEDMVKNNPDLVTRFLRAALKSYMWTMDHKKEAMEEIVKVSPDRDLDLETKKSEIIFGLYNSPEYADGFGTMNDEKWASSIAILNDSGDLPQQPDPSEMYTNAFIEALPEAKELGTALGAATN